MTSPSTSAQATTTVPVLYMALELAKAKWVVTSSPGLLGRSPRRVQLDPCLDYLLREIGLAKRRFQLPEETAVVTVYEAGFSGFWLHRALTDVGVSNIVTKSCTLARKRKGRKAKTDRLDAEALLRALIRFHRDGDADELYPIEVPGSEDEDDRVLSRERGRLLKQKNQHCSQLRSLLMLQGVTVETPQGLRAEDLDHLRGADGKPLSRNVKRAVCRGICRRNVVLEQMKEVEKERQEIVRKGASQCARVVRQLMLLKGIGLTGAWVCSYEFLGWRKFRNRREVGAATGLVGTPNQSGETEWDQGISKAGSTRLRSMLVELSWLWLRYQPESELTKWYQRRFGDGRRSRRIGIVAVARRLAVALWKYVKWGEIPEGAVLSTEG